MDKELAKLLSRLTALKNNIPQSGFGIPQKYVIEFNSILSELEAISDESLDVFTVPESEVQRRVSGGNYLTGEVDYTSERYCDRDFILMKIDGILGYFTLLLQPAEIKNQMGFRVEEND